MAVTLDPATKVFTVPQADLTFISGTLYEMDTEAYFRTQVNALMDDEDYIWMPDPIDHNTEYTVVGVTYARKIEMINGYSLTFTPDSQWSVRFTGSNNNLFDVEGGILNQNQVQVIPANSAGLQSFPQKELDNIRYRLESLRERHAGIGEVYFLDPINGDDLLAGDEPSTARKTWASIQSDLIVDGNKDVVFIISPSGSTMTERISVTKSGVSIRGPGREMLVKPTDDTGDTISITANDVSISGLSVETFASGTPRRAVFADGADNLRLSNLFIDVSTGDGIHIDGGSHHQIENCVIEECAGDGIELHDCENAVVRGCQIERCTGWGMILESSGSSDPNRCKDVQIDNCVFHHNGPGSIWNKTNSSMTIIRDTNYIGRTDVIVDDGSGTHNEIAEQAKTRKIGFD